MSGKIHLGLRKLTTDFATSDWKALIAGKEKRIKLLSRVELLVVLAVQEELLREKIALSNSIDTFSSKCQIERERGGFPTKAQRVDIVTKSRQNVPS